MTSRKLGLQKSTWALARKLSCKKFQIDVSSPRWFLNTVVKARRKTQKIVCHSWKSPSVTLFRWCKCPACVASSFLLHVNHSPRLKSCVCTCQFVDSAFEVSEQTTQTIIPHLIPHTDRCFGGRLSVPGVSFVCPNLRIEMLAWASKRDDDKSGGTMDNAGWLCRCRNGKEHSQNDWMFECGVVHGHSQWKCGPSWQPLHWLPMPAMCHQHKHANARRLRGQAVLGLFWNRGQMVETQWISQEVQALLDSSELTWQHFHWLLDSKLNAIVSLHCKLMDTPHQNDELQCGMTDWCQLNLQTVSVRCEKSAVCKLQHDAIPTRLQLISAFLTIMSVFHILNPLFLLSFPPGAWKKPQQLSTFQCIFHMAWQGRRKQPVSGLEEAANGC